MATLRQLFIFECEFDSDTELNVQVIEEDWLIDTTDTEEDEKIKFLRDNFHLVKKQKPTKDPMKSTVEVESKKPECSKDKENLPHRWTRASKSQVWIELQRQDAKSGHRDIKGKFKKGIKERKAKRGSKYYV